jgi:hypothetical protein
MEDDDQEYADEAAERDDLPDGDVPTAPEAGDDVPTAPVDWTGWKLLGYTTDFDGSLYVRAAR